MKTNMAWDLLLADKSRYFWCERNQGDYLSGHPESYYASGSDPEEATYDTGNNRVITNSGLDGELKTITFFKDCYYADHIPGVWVHKDKIIGGPFRFSVIVKGKEIALPKWNGRLRTDLLEGIVPLTTYYLDSIKLSVITFSPVSSDGKKRPRGAYYNIYAENISDEIQEIGIILPGVPSYQTAGDSRDNVQLSFSCSGYEDYPGIVECSLEPGEKKHLSVWISVYPCEGKDNISNESEWWLRETLGYYQNIFGTLKFPENDFLGEFFKRTLCQCTECIGITPNDELAGSSWGTYPTTSQIWMKDLYYSILPLIQMEPELIKKGILWFAKYGVRPKGYQFKGGVSHSLSNSLSGIFLAGRYYSVTGDKKFFTENPELIKGYNRIIEEMLKSRKEEEVWLFPSEWVSDGLSVGDYHTGSNIMAWASLMAAARLLREIYDDVEHAEYYESIAGKVKEFIFELCVADGPYGLQLTEATGDGPKELRKKMKADSYAEFLEKQKGFGVQFFEFFNLKKEGEPYMVHDGEETDTTLIPYYGMALRDNLLLRNYTRFAMTKDNRFYSPVSKGILWENCSDATFPGYITGLSNTKDRQSFNYYFEIIKKLTDLDGSIWWWPYPHGSKDSNIMKREPGKCGWASGAFIAYFINDIMGLMYEGNVRRLHVKPLNTTGGYDWRKAVFGYAKFNIIYNEKLLIIENLNEYEITIDVQLFGRKMLLNGNELQAECGKLFDKSVVSCNYVLKAGGKARLTAIP